MPLWSVICRFQNANTKAKCKGKGKCIGKSFLCPKCSIYLLNAAVKRDFSISEGKYKGKMQIQSKGKGIRKWFLCPKCGIYLLNAAMKRDLSISECKYKGKMQRQRQMHQENGFYALNAAFISWMPLWSVISRFQKASARQMERQRQRHRKIFFMP